MARATIVAHPSSSPVNTTSGENSRTVKKSRSTDKRWPNRSANDVPPPNANSAKADFDASSRSSTLTDSGTALKRSIERTMAGVGTKHNKTRMLSAGGSAGRSQAWPTPAFHIVPPEFSSPATGHIPERAGPAMRRGARDQLPNGQHPRTSERKVRSQLEVTHSDAGSKERRSCAGRQRPSF